MREIEFRAWHESEKVILQIGDEFGTSHPLDCCNYFIEGQPVELMQYTGLTDTNGVKVFEGDIVRCENRHVWQVSFDRGCFVAHTPGDDSEFVFLDDYDFEVIGNIHQHPHLMEAK